METKKYENYEDMLKAAREEYLAKVPEGMKEVASGQIDMVLDGIREMAEKNPAFAEKLLLPWKSFEKCYKYMKKKAYEMSTNKKTCVVVSTLLFDWVNEYYMLDDKAEWEEKQKEQQKKKEESEKKSIRESVEADREVYKQLYGDADDSVSSNSPAPAKPVVTKIAKTKYDCDGQLDLFGLAMA